MKFPFDGSFPATDWKMCSTFVIMELEARRRCRDPSVC